MQKVSTTKSGCLSDSNLEAFVQSNETTDTLTAWRRHIRLCDNCAFRLAQLRTNHARLRTNQPPLQIDSNLQPSSPSNSPPVEHKALQTFSGLEPNIQLGDFRIEKRLGSGGMGVVYQAHQISLNRHVALKVLHLDFTADKSAVERFHREARAAAKLHHPNIISIHTVGEKDGICYYVMDKIDGQTLDEIIQNRQASHAALKDTGAFRKDHPACSETPVEGHTSCDTSSIVSEILTTRKPNKLYFESVAQLIAEVADSLDYAHLQGVIHRDVKPGNIIIARDGRPVLTDFGIARLMQEQSMKITNAYIGTPQYMSPEQVTGNRLKLDHRTDIYSLGAALYELLTLHPSLKPAEDREGLMYQILHETPRRPRYIDKRIPVDLETICCKAMEKDVDRRYPTAAEFAEDLRRFINGQPIKAKPGGPVDTTWKFVRRYRLPVSLVVGMFVITLVATVFTQKYFRTRYLHRNVIPVIVQKIDQTKYFEAFQLLKEAEGILPEDPVLSNLARQVSRPYSITTDPPGANIYCDDLFTKTHNTIFLGRSPIPHAGIPFGTFRWRIEKEGFQTIESLQSNNLPFNHNKIDAVKYVHFTLHSQGQFPADMVWIPPSDLDVGHFFHIKKTISSAPEYLIDKYEVTNRQFKEFIDKGGYQHPGYWEHEFIREGKVIVWQEAMKAFKDTTGCPGPAGWINGSYPDEQAHYPVGGISWFEASAYAKFRDKDLPTLFHWRQAAIEDEVPTRICSMSNFSETISVIGAYPGISPFGLYDIAGNVREWCYNSLQGQPERRCILGGAWGENDYMFSLGVAQSCWDRSLKNGFRCMRYLGGKSLVPQDAFEPLKCKFRDMEHFQPISDEEYFSYINTLYPYDHTPLNARIESVREDLEFCRRREKISFEAVYSNEKIPANLFLPIDSTPPYQMVIWFPGAGATKHAWDDESNLNPEIINILKSGRALIIPHYTLTYSRRIETIPPKDSVQGRDLFIKISKDLRRTIDYLETRDDIDIGKLAYVGLSWGGMMGSLMIAPEPRIKTGIFLIGGICACERHPATDPANFAPHVTVPILMINGREDPVFNYDLAQKPLFDLLGTPDAEKKHVLFPGGHCILWEYRVQYFKEITDWLDHWLGPVNKNNMVASKDAY